MFLFNSGCYILKRNHCRWQLSPSFYERLTSILSRIAEEEGFDYKESNEAQDDQAYPVP